MKMKAVTFFYNSNLLYRIANKETDCAILGYDFVKSLQEGDLIKFIGNDISCIVAIKNIEQQDCNRSCLTQIVLKKVIPGELNTDYELSGITDCLNYKEDISCNKKDIKTTKDVASIIIERSDYEYDALFLVSEMSELTHELTRKLTKSKKHSRSGLVMELSHVLLMSEVLRQREVISEEELLECQIDATNKHDVKNK